MGSGSSLPDDKHCVVIGAGYAGTTVALGLMKGKAKFTIIDARDSFHHCVAAVRAVVNTDIIPKTLIPLKDTFGDNFKQGKVTQINPQNKTVTLESGEEIHYDVLVIATGSSCPFPGKTTLLSRQEIMGQYEEFVQKIKSSNSIAIVGGGPIGVEIASEIGTKFTGSDAKSVTIIHSKEHLVGADFSQKFYKKLDETLKKFNITVITGEKVTNLDQIPEEGAFKLITDKGTEIEADLCLTCTGSHVNSESYKESLASSTESHGMLKVGEDLRVEGFEDIFALGDCANIAEYKIAYLAERQAEVVVNNIALLLKNQQLKKYIPGKAPVKMVLSLGPNSGTGETKNGKVLPGFLVTKVKSQGMLVSKRWNTMKQTQP